METETKTFVSSSAYFLISVALVVMEYLIQHILGLSNPLQETSLDLSTIIFRLKQFKENDEHWDELFTDAVFSH